jgi:hypothetical protein
VLPPAQEASTATIRVGWYADDPDPALASIRLRMLLPMRELVAAGVHVAAYDRSHGVRAYDTLVFSKSLTRAGLGVARKARSAGCRLVYDLCDNLHQSRPGRRRRRRVAVVEEFLALADLVVFSTPVLRAQMLELHPRLATRSMVIPDALDTAGAPPGPLGQWRLRRLQRFLMQHSDALHCVWFGKSQGRLAGLEHLKLAVRQLEEFSRLHPVTLTVISNRWMAYRRVCGQGRIPHCYLPWSQTTFMSALRAHQVAVIPVVANGYTAGKSINRPATAIMAGLGVVADSIDSYRELAQFVVLDRWQEGLHYYASNPPALDPRLAQAREYIADRYGGRSIAALWRQAVAGGGGPSM